MSLNILLLHDIFLFLFIYFFTNTKYRLLYIRGAILSPNFIFDFVYPYNK